MIMKAIKIRELNGGTQRIYRFANNYGASVVKHSFSYGRENGRWELAVLRFTGDNYDDYKLEYNTPITGDVLGNLTEADYEEVLKQIEKL